MLLLSSLVIIASLAVSCAYDTSFLSEMLKDSIKPITLANRNDAILSMKESIMATPTQRTAHNASSVNAASAVREVFGEIRELQSNGFDDAGKNGRKLQASFTCEPPQGFNPFSQCSDIVDYPFLVPANSNLYEMEYAVRLSIDFTEIPYVDNVCLTDYKRMRCAQIYMPCVAGGKYHKYMNHSFVRFYIARVLFS